LTELTGNDFSRSAQLIKQRTGYDFEGVNWALLVLLNGAQLPPEDYSSLQIPLLHPQSLFNVDKITRCFEALPYQSRFFLLIPIIKNKVINWREIFDFIFDKWYCSYHLLNQTPSRLWVLTYVRDFLVSRFFQHIKVHNLALLTPLLSYHEKLFLLGPLFPFLHDQRLLDALSLDFPLSICNPCMNAVLAERDYAEGVKALSSYTIYQLQQ